MEPQGFPSDIVMLFMLFGVIFGIARGMHVRKSHMTQDARSVIEALKSGNKTKKHRQ